MPMKRLPMKLLPFKFQILAGCMLVALVPLLVNNILSISMTEAQLRTQNNMDAERRLDEMEGRLETLMDELAAASGRVNGDRLLLSVLLGNRDSTETEANLRLYNAGRDLPPGITLSVYDAGGMLRYTTNSSMAYATLPVRWGVLRKAASTDGMAWYNIENRLGSPYTTHTARRLETDGGALVGYAVASLTPAAFRQLFSGAADVFLLDGAGEIIYPTEEPEELGWLRGRIAAGYYSHTGENYSYTVRHCPAHGYYIVLRQPVAMTSGVTETMRGVSAATIAISLILCVVFAAVIGQYLAKPVDDVNVRLLQAQLNPHFLYNTLDTVKWLAKINKVPEIAGIVSDLAIILRQSISGTSFVTLAKELDMLRSYVNIQRIRFSGRFQVIMDAPDELKDCVIPKLILQPLVENAIIHGLADMENGCISLGFEKRGGVLEITVSDDGRGMPPELVERINSGKLEYSEGHLGLFNISRIVERHYGEPYGLRARNTGSGAEVTLRLPARRQKETLECTR